MQTFSLLTRETDDTALSLISTGLTSPLLQRNRGVPFYSVHSLSPPFNGAWSHTDPTFCLLWKAGYWSLSSFCSSQQEWWVVPPVSEEPDDDDDKVLWQMWIFTVSLAYIPFFDESKTCLSQKAASWSASSFHSSQQEWAILPVSEQHNDDDRVSWHMLIFTGSQARILFFDESIKTSGCH